MRSSTLYRHTGIAIIIIAFYGCFSDSVTSEGNRNLTRETAVETNIDNSVVREDISIPAPVPPVNGNPPAEAHRVEYIKYRVNTGGAPAVPDRVLLLMPGFFVGANTITLYARNLVHVAKRDYKTTIDVLVVERRYNNIEDLHGLNAAEEARDPRLAIDYYWNGAEVAGKKFAGWLKDGSAPYLSEFGLAQYMDDCWAVMRREVPDRAARKSKLFMGGHSLAGFVAAVFAAWDFDANPDTLEDAGYNNIAGFVALDSAVSSMKAILDPYLNLLGPALYERVNTMTESGYVSLIKDLREGSIRRTLPLNLIGFGEECITFLEILGMYAHWMPDAESTAFADIPLSSSVRNLLRFLHSRTAGDFFDGSPDISDFRFTNEALLGVLFDNNFEPVSLIQVGLGFLNGGPIAQRHFPLGPSATELPFNLYDQLLSSLIRADNVYIATSSGGDGNLYSWTPFDEIGTPENPLYLDPESDDAVTDLMHEPTDMSQFSKQLFDGSHNMFENFFTIRFTIDLLAACLPFGTKYGINYYHHDRAGEVPSIQLVTERGPFNVFGRMMGVVSGESIEAYNHLDIVMASIDRPDRRPHEAITPVIEFMLEK